MKFTPGIELAPQNPRIPAASPVGIGSCAPSLFKHGELLSDLEKAPRLDQEALTNMINHIHFTDGYVQILMGHPLYRETILLRAFPAPCMGDRVLCTWADDASVGLDLQRLSFRYLIIDDGLSIILAPGTVKKINRKHVVVELPKTSFSSNGRQSRRLPCRDISAELLQNGFQAHGELVEFNPGGFRIRVSQDPSCSFRWLNPEENAVVQLKGKGRLLFSEPCRIVRQEGRNETREIVLSPLHTEIRRHKKKPFRSIRQELKPRPRMLFIHPFLGKKLELEICDISTSGFSVCEETEERILCPGTILPEVTIEFAGLLKTHCSAQVIYSKPMEDGGFRCGLAILDMDIQAYSSLNHVLTKTLDACANVSSDTDIDTLWKFFFETGFIYPKKYRMIQHQRTKFKETYKKLYHEAPEVARHFTYENNGRIYGHVSMVRAYERAWMIHHYAAKVLWNRRTGFMVLKLIMNYLNDMHRLPSANMDYVMCYFRPENKFPERVFGGFTKELNDPRGCSLDRFAYLPYTRLSISSKFPEGWALNPVSDLDLWEYERIYRGQSGGLLMEALGLAPQQGGHESIEDVYAGLSMVRKRRVFSLRHKGDLSALIIANQTDFGLNLSELLNGIKVLVAQETLPWSVLSVAVSQLAADYPLERIPLLFYPASYVEGENVPCEKDYCLWILNVQRGNEYMDYMQKRFHISYKPLMPQSC
jgi:hypothetical protein